MESSKKITWSELKEFVRNLDISGMELNPEEISLNEMASVGGLLSIHSDNLFMRAKLVKAKSELDGSEKMFKQFKDGDFNKK